MEEIKELLAITKKLKEKYVHLNKNFSLDGKLVGDIGEVLAAEKYGLELLPENTPVHDGKEKASNRMVQLKASFKGNCYFPFGEERIPDFFLAIEINEDGQITEMYNGPGRYLYENYILKKKLKPYKNSYYNLAKGELKKLNASVLHQDKVKPIK
jgi:hypothetical protein